MTLRLGPAIRWPLLAALAAALFALASAGPTTASAAGKPRVQTTPTIKFEGSFSGRLKTQARCKPQRVVRLFQKADGPDEEMAKRKTKKLGRYDFGDEVLPTDGGTFYVQAAKRKIDSAVCRGGRSKSIAFAG